MYLLLLRNQMKWTNYIIPGLFVWLMQLILSDFLAIETVRPDFPVILILYWSVKYGRAVGTVSGFLLGLLVDLSGTATFFGLSPLIYSVTGYLGGNLAGSYTKINPFYFSITWITILAFQFLIFCGVQYQDLWFINWHLFFGKWLGTTLYTLSFVAILQFIFPLHRVA